MKSYTVISVLVCVGFFWGCNVELEKTGAVLEVTPTEIRLTQDDTLTVLTVKNMGNEDLDWKIKSAPSWLSFSKQSGHIKAGVADTFSVTYQKSLLDTVVEIRDNIVLSSNVNSATILVIFQSEQPSLKVTPTKVEYGPEQISKKIAILNTRTGYLDWKATVSVDWCTISPDTGHTGPDMADTAIVTIDPHVLPEAGEYTATIKIVSDANGPAFFTKITEDVKVTFYYLGIDVSGLRNREKMFFPTITYNGNTMTVPTEFYIQPIGQKEPCSWEILSGQLPAGIQFEVQKYNGASSAKFSGVAENEIYAELLLRVTDAMGSFLEQPVAIVSQFIEVTDPEMVPIPAGGFIMGDSWEDGLTVERPAHDVTVAAFQIGKYEVTNEEFYKFVLSRGYHTRDYWLITDGSDDEEAGWQEVVTDNIHQPRCWSSSEVPWDTCSASNQPNSPVVGISWYEAHAYCNWLSQITGTTFRLPTEAQWERSARGAGSGLRYPWGNDWQNNLANWNDGGQEDGFLFAAPVASFENGKSAEGCYDLAGNVWEWCQDWYGEYQSTAVTDPIGPSTGKTRVIKGGSWKSIPRSLRSASRTSLAPNAVNTNVGFRLAVVE